MATRGTNLTDTPVNLVTTLDPPLEEDMQYTLETTGQTDVYYTESATTPDDTTFWHILHRNDGANRIGVLVKEGMGVWARTPIIDDEITRMSFRGLCRVTATEAE